MIAVLVAVYAVQVVIELTAGRAALYQVFREWGLVPAALARGERFHTLLTYGFLHANPLHLIVNSVSLYFLGREVEEKIGTAALIACYLAFIVLGGVAYALINPDPTAALIGASAAVFGFLGIIALLEPFSLTYVVVIPVPTILIAVGYTVFCLFFIHTPLWWGGIAHSAHLGGLLGGMLLAIPIEPKKALEGLVIYLALLGLVLYAIWLTLRLLL